MREFKRFLGPRLAARYTPGQLVDLRRDMHEATKLLLELWREKKSRDKGGSITTNCREWYGGVVDNSRQENLPETANFIGGSSCASHERKLEPLDARNIGLRGDISE